VVTGGVENGDDEDDGEEDEEGKSLKLVVNGNLKLNGSHAFQLKNKASVYVSGSINMNNAGTTMDVNYASTFYVHQDININNNGAILYVNNPTHQFVNFFVKKDLSVYGGTIDTANITYPDGRLNMFVQGKLSTGNPAKFGTGLPDRLITYLPNKDVNGNTITQNHEVSAWQASIKAGIYAPASKVSTDSNILGAITCETMSSYSGTKTYSPLMAAINLNGNTVFPNNNSNNDGIVTIKKSDTGWNDNPVNRYWDKNYTPFNLQFAIESVPAVPSAPSGTSYISFSDINNGENRVFPSEGNYQSSGNYRLNKIQVNRGTLKITGPANIYIDNGIEVNNGSSILAEGNVSFFIKGKLQLNNGSSFLIKDSSNVYVGNEMESNASTFIYEGTNSEGSSGGGEDDQKIKLGHISWKEQ